MSEPVAPFRICLMLEEDYNEGWLSLRNISHLLVELNEEAISERELGYDGKGGLIYRWQTGDVHSEHGLFTPELLDRSTAEEFSREDFDGLWSDRINSVEFFSRP